MDITQDVISAINKLSQDKPLFLVAVDGQSGGGKSTLARTLQKEFSAQIVPLDDFYAVLDENERLGLSAEQGFEQYFDWQRAEKEVLSPLRDGLDVSYRKYNWSQNALGEKLNVTAKGIIIIEGVYALRPQLQKYYDYKIFIDTPLEIRFPRLIERGQDSSSWIKRWEEAEVYYVEKYNPKSTADIIVR